MPETVQRHAFAPWQLLRNDATSFTTPIQVSTASSNPEASSYNNLQEQFVGDYIGLARMPHGFAGAFSMAKPIARDAIDVYFVRATTSRGSDR